MPPFYAEALPTQFEAVRLKADEEFNFDGPGGGDWRHLLDTYGDEGWAAVGFTPDLARPGWYVVLLQKSY